MWQDPRAQMVSIRPRAHGAGRGKDHPEGSGHGKDPEEVEAVGFRTRGRLYR